MKQKVFALLALLMAVMAASARTNGYALTLAAGAEAHGKISFTVGGSVTNAAAPGATVTITVEPDDEWEVTAVSGQTYMTGGEMRAPRRRALGTDIDILGDVTMTPDATNPHIFTFVMPTAAVRVSVSYRQLDAEELALKLRITSIEKQYAIDEHSEAGTVVAKLTVVDKNQQDGDFVALTYTLEGSCNNVSVSDLFNVVETANISGVRTVEISVKDAELLDYRQLNANNGKIETTLSVKDAVGLSATAKTTIIVNDVNEAPAVSDQSFTLAEKNGDGSDWPAGKQVGVVSASDPDGASLAYKVVTAGVPFAFENGTSMLIVTDGSVLDYETKTVWTFDATVSDGELSQDFTVTVNLTDVNEAPVIADVKNVYSVNENTATGTSFGTFTVTENDADDKLTYTLTGAAGITGTLKNKTLADIFYVDEPANSSGKRTASIRVKSSALLDYEELYKTSSKNATYPVTITITDKALNSVDVTTRITVQDVNEDLTATGGTFYIQEHSPGLSHVSNTKNYQDCSESEYSYVTGKDDDKYNKSFSTLTYSISSANTDAQAADAANFFIDPNDGCIFTAANAEFEYDGDDAKKSYTFLVTVSDGEFSKDVSVTVEVLDITEPPINLVTEGSGRIREDATKGTNAASFSKDYITDPDELAKFEALRDDVRFTISETASGYGVFKANVENGEINLLDPSEIDFETLCAKDASCTSPMYTVEMTASNADGSVSLNITRNIEIVDVNEPPTASDFTKSVDENIAGGTSIGFISASDPDVYASCKTINNPDGTSTIHHSCGFNTLHYSIVDASGLPFEIDQATGEIKLKKNERLRYIEKNQYKFDVKVSDRATSEPALSTIAHVTINLIDVNEPSEFVTLDDVYVVEENMETGTTLEGGTIVVLDDDQADADKLTITITNNDATATRDAANLFEVVQVRKTDQDHKSTFAIKTKAALDYEALYNASEKGAVFNVKLTITDQAENRTSQDTKIRVIDVNEEPRFAQESFAFTVSENTTRETSLGVAKAEDPDIYNAQYGTLYFSLEGDDAASFMIASTGEIFTVRGAKFDYETKDTYEFKAVVTDKNSTVRVPVTVTVSNVAEGPEFAEVNPTMIVDECAQQGTVVGTVTAIDDDMTNNHTGKAPFYSLVATDDSADDYKKFAIDNEGTIIVAADALAAFTDKSVYWVRVVATDGSDLTLSTYTDVAINVSKKMDNLFSGSNLWTDYVSPANLLLPDGMTGYVVTAIDGASATVAAIDYIPQLTPVLLKRDDETVNSFSAPKGFGTTFDTNQLRVTTSDRTVSAGELYLLHNDEFVLTSSGTLPAGRVYLPVTAGANARRLTIGPDGGNATGVTSPLEGEGSGSAWYCLDGRKLGKAPTKKGVYIKDGRKVVVK